MLETGMGRIMLFAGGSWVILIGLALILPIRGLHRKIRSAKDAELEWVNRAIAEERRALAAADTTRRSGDMADLVAYRNLVSSVSEWPFTSSNYARILLYALIPAASWGLGLVAEQFVEQLL